MNDTEFNDLVLALIREENPLQYRVHVARIIEETRRLRKLVQCCERDNDYDGNCKIHSKKLPLMRDFQEIQGN